MHHSRRASQATWLVSSTRYYSFGRIDHDGSRKASGSGFLEALRGRSNGTRQHFWRRRSSIGFLDGCCSWLWVKGMTKIWWVINSPVIANTRFRSARPREQLRYKRLTKSNFNCSATYRLKHFWKKSLDEITTDAFIKFLCVQAYASISMQPNIFSIYPPHATTYPQPPFPVPQSA